MWCMLDYLAAEREFKVGATDGFLDWKLHINESLESSSELDPLKKRIEITILEFNVLKK